MSEEEKPGPSAGSSGVVSVDSQPDQPYILLQNSDSGGPPRYVTLSQMMDTNALMTNMTLAHEIAVDSDFKIQVSKKHGTSGSLADRVEGVMKRAMWDLVREQLNASPPEYEHALILLEEIKEYLIRCLLPTNIKLKAHIEEVMDMDLLRQKVANNAFVLSDCSRFLVDTMKKLCAPARDEEVAALAVLTDPVDLFRDTFTTLEHMHMDMANFAISQVRPLIRKQSVAYEKKKFEEFLNQQQGMGIDGLHNTKRWVDRSDKSLLNEEKFGSNIKELERSPAAMLMGAYMELLQWTDNEFPETCFMDEARYMACGYRLRQVSLISSIVYLLSSYLKLSMEETEKVKVTLVQEISVLLQDVSERDYPEKLKNVAEHIIRDLSGARGSPAAPYTTTATSSNNTSESNIGDSPRSSLPSSNLNLSPSNAPLATSSHVLPGARPGSASPPPSKMMARSSSPGGGPYAELRSSVERLWPGHVLYKSLLKRALTFALESLQAVKVDRGKIPKGFTAAGGEQMADVIEQFLRLVSHNRAVFGQWYSSIIRPYFSSTEPTGLSPRQ